MSLEDHSYVKTLAPTLFKMEEVSVDKECTKVYRDVPVSETLITTDKDSKLYTGVASVFDYC